jgi:hypothetical protein
VVALGSDSVKQALQKHCRADQQILDLSGLPKSMAIAAKVEGLNW